MLHISVLPYLSRIYGMLTRSQAANRQTPQQQVAEEPAEQFTIKKTIKGAVLMLEGTYQGKPIRVRIFGEPVAEPIPEHK